VTSAIARVAKPRTFSLPDRASARLPEAMPKSLTAWAKPTKRASGRASTAWAAVTAPPADAAAKAARNERRAIGVMGLLGIFRRLPARSRVEKAALWGGLRPA